MVSKPVAGAGLVVLLVGIAMMITITFLQEWVVLSLTGVPKCTDPYLGKLGLFKATMDTSCTVGSPYESVYASFPSETMPTTEFWPLFPSQTNYGGIVEGNPTFESCESYYATGGAAQQGINSYINTKVIPNGFASVDAGLAEQYANLTSIVDTLVTTVDGAIAGIWAGAVANGVKDMINGTVLQEPALIAGYDNIATALVAGGSLDITFPSDMSQGLQGADIGNVCGPAAKPVVTASDGVCPPSMVLTYLALDAAIASGGDANIQAAITTAKTLLGAAVQAGLVCDNSHANFAACLGAQPDKWLFGLNLVTPLNALTAAGYNFNATGFKGLIDAAASAPGASAEEQQASALLNTCTGAGHETASACAAVYNKVQSNMTSTWGLCVIAQASGLLSGLPANPADCNVIAVFTAIATVPANAALLGPGIAAYASAIPSIVQVLAGCGQAGLTWEQCEYAIGNPAFFTGGAGLMDNADQSKIPESFAHPFALCLGIKLDNPSVNCTTFDEFIGLAAASSTDLATFKAAFYDTCVGAGQSTRTGCIAALQGMPLYPGDTVLPDLAYAFKKSVYQQVVNNLLDGNTEAELVQSCKDDEEDIRRIKLAQVLIPTAIGLEGVAAILAVAAVATNKGPLTIVAAVLCLAGTGMSLAALLMVKAAPVYSNVEASAKAKEEGTLVDGERFYEAGLAETLGMVGIFAPAVAAILLAVAGFLNRAGSESAMTSKVDTYN